MGKGSEMEELGIMEDLRAFYRGKRIFLTGHTGFKGSWMLLLLRELGAEVSGYALEPARPNDLYKLIDGDTLCNSRIADIRDSGTLRKAVEKAQPDLIFHFAAQALVRESYRIPQETFDTNVMGSVHVLEAFRELKKSCTAVMITTDKVYENMEWEFHYKESDRLGGFDPYSSSKAGAEIAIASYQKAFFGPERFNKHHKALAAARGGNVIGGGDRAEDRIIPDLVRSIEKNEALKVRNPGAIRPWQHVLELLYGYLLLGKKLREDPGTFQGAFNFGPGRGDEMTVEELVKHAIRIYGKGKYAHREDQEKLHEAGILRLNIEKAQRLLGWEPRWRSEEAVEKTIRWYRDVARGNRPPGAAAGRSANISRTGMQDEDRKVSFT
ncbi:MAG: CDP-glucose 4,6-dehydratase [Candidatus Marinimicrobia bacterium]|nr:CDP-glucose 4,6-dehydratase [Candidatus Neomarinimicrobiota bacterium]